LNEGQGIHSIYNPATLVTGGPWEQVLVVPFFTSPHVDLASIRNMAIVGLAAGTTARQATVVFPNIQIDGFEIDPKIITVARTYFDMNEPNLNVIVQDGRVGLADSNQKYDVISIDAYRPPYIPPHLTTREFFQIVHQHLTENGSMVINVGRSPKDRVLIDSLYNTIHAVFPSVYVMDIPNSMNSILYATVQPTTKDNLLANFNVLLSSNSPDSVLLIAMKSAIDNLQSPPPIDPGMVFTDDRSPIEWLTNKMVVSFVLSDQMESLK